MATRQAEGPFNLERGVALGFAMLLAFLAGDYLQSRPAPVADDLRPPRLFKVPPMPSAPRPHMAEAPVASVANPFLLAPLLKTRVTPITEVVVNPTPTNPNLPPATVLPPKPKAEPTTTQAPTPTETQPPFPLKISGILKMDDGSGVRRVLAAPLADPGNDFTLGEGEEWTSGDAHLRVVEIAPTYAVFQWDGRTIRIDQDPLKDWKPILKDEKPEEGEANGLDTLENLFVTPETPPANHGKSPAPDRQTRPDGKPGHKNPVGRTTTNNDKIPTLRLNPAR